MFGLFTGLEIGKRALLSQQSALTTTGHNIANATTPGYVRQRVEMSATDPFVDATGRFGTGVKVGTVRQIRDLFLTRNFRQESGNLAEWSTRERTLAQVETLFSEPSERGLNQWLEDFFNSWHELSLSPDDPTARDTVVEKAKLLATSIQHLDRRLETIATSLNDEISAGVTELNELAVQVADLNRRIARQELDGQSANDLRDRRALLIDQMSAKANISVIEESTGIQRVFVGTMEFVESASYTPLATQTPVGSSLSSQFSVVWKGTLTTVEPQGGELTALTDLRDVTLPEYRRRLDELAKALVTSVNAIHQPAYGLDGVNGRAFFDPNGVTAGTIAVDSAILNDHSLIATSASGAPGDGSGALDIANLQNALTMNGATTTFSQFYGSLVGVVGVQSREAIDSRENFALVVQQVEMARESIQGVSIDEEMANLIKFQHAYDAAARVITTLDEVIETIIHGMGA